MSDSADPYAFDLDDLEDAGGLFAAARRRAAGQPDLPQVQDEPSPQPQATAKPKASPPKPFPTDEPANLAAVVRWARARLKVVEREIKTRKALEKERDQIKRLLDAAKDKPAAKVRRIQQAG